MAVKQVLTINMAEVASNGFFSSTPNLAFSPPWITTIMPTMKDKTSNIALFMVVVFSDSLITDFLHFAKYLFEYKSWHNGSPNRPEMK